jgi:cytochrome c oxidase assembly protein subunit 15
MRERLWIQRLALIGALLCFGVVVLGGYTRLSNSGLGCPDWPGCFGHIAPTGSAEHYASDADVRKAWVEMIHRYFASTLGLIIAVIAALSIRARREPGIRVSFALLLLVLVVLQGMLGMLTVTWLLKPLIVTGHLVGGLTTFALLLWLWLSMRAEAREVDGYSVLAGNTVVESGRRARLWAGLGLAALALQVGLGGWTSSNYAAVACPDVPKCQAQWFPEADYGMHSCCGAASESTTPAACWTILRAWPSISRTGWARCWRRPCCCWQHFPRFAALAQAHAGRRWPFWPRSRHSFA